MAKKKANELDFIQWEDKGTGLQLFGTVRRVLDNSVIVDVIDVDDSTVVSHKRYKVIKEAEIDESAGEQFRKARLAVGARKWF